MKLVEDNHRLSTVLIDHIDVVLPHVAAYTLNSSGALLSPPCEKSLRSPYPG